MKKVLRFLLVFAAVAMFAACSDDDKDEPDTGGNTGGGTETPTGSLTVSLGSSTDTFKVTHYTNTSDGDAISKTVTVTASETSEEAYSVTLAVDNSLVSTYNSSNGTSYGSLSDVTIVNIPTATMQAGSRYAAVTITISDSDRNTAFTDDGGYVIPIVISDGGSASVASNSGVEYLVIEVEHVSETLDYFSALYLGNYEMATWYQFKNAIDLSNGYTYVFHALMEEVTTHSRIGDFADIDENWINMLRFGQEGNNTTTLEWYVGPNGNRYNITTKTSFQTDIWYQVALVYDPSSKAFNFYLEGELEASQSFTSSPGNPSFQAIEFNSSWDENDRSGNEFHGRLWHVGVFNKALSADEIKLAYHDFNSSLFSDSSYGLVAYWGFDEGEGYVCKEGTGSYEDVDFSNTIRCDDQSTMVSADVSEYIEWKRDELNYFE